MRSAFVAAFAVALLRTSPGADETLSLKFMIHAVLFDPSPGGPMSSATAKRTASTVAGSASMRIIS